MAVNAQIVAAWSHNGDYYLAVRPAAPAPDKDVEYLGSTPLLNPDGTAKSKLQLVTECLGSIRQSRTQQLSVLTPDPGSVGPVQL